MTKILHATAPSSWASYLVNSDDSGLSPEEIIHADAFVKQVNAGAPVNCHDAGFIWHHDAYGVFPFGANCQKYTFIANE